MPFNILTGWIDAALLGDASHMRFVPLSDDDCARAALAARAIASAHELNAQKHVGGFMRFHSEDQARRYRALAQHFEEAGKSSHSA